MKNLIIILFLLCVATGYSQPKPRDLALLENPLRDFTLPVYQGGSFTLSEHTEKNVLLVFPRGYYDKDFNIIA